ncbi:MAG: ADP-ribosylglycohydrolase family protein, partial [Thermomicrobiales bacterium]
FGGACHMVPNHALIIMALLYGGDDFRKAQMIINTAGWDTDCNAANVGAILGVKNGLAGIDGSDYDWRGPVADRMYLSAADGGRTITDAVIETYHIVNAARGLAGLEPLAPKDGARFHFSLPGSVQGFQSDNEDADLVNNDGALEIQWDAGMIGAAVVSTPTFTPEEALVDLGTYTMIASPTLYSGQEVQASVAADGENLEPARVALTLTYYGADDSMQSLTGPAVELAAGEARKLRWTVPDTHGLPIASIGLQVEPDGDAGGVITLDRLDWGGTPTTTLTRPDGPGTQWQAAWVNGVDQMQTRWWDSFRLSKNEGTGLISQGTSDWEDYTVSADISLMLAQQGGLAARVGGLRRWYALVLCDDGMVRLVKDREAVSVLSERAFPVELDRYYRFELTVEGDHLIGRIDGEVVADVHDTQDPLLAGGVGLLVTVGTISSDAVTVQPVAA